MPEQLTELEHQILQYLVDYLREHTYQPSIREIGRRFGIKSTKTVSEHLQSLANKGWIERDPSRSRGVRILNLDLYGGRTPFKAEPHELRLTAASGRDGARFEATSAGASGTGVRTGDQLLVEPVGESQLRDGDVIAARHGTELTAGRCKRHGTGLLMEWAAGMMLPIRPERSRDLEILGRVIGFFRPVGVSPTADAQATPGAEES
ncbi:MAG: hypothetical protein ACRELV_14255 [Longimicrobiales bacterium]